MNQLLLCGGRCGRDHMLVGFTTTCVTSAYHHLCFLNLNPAHDIQHYVINFVYVTNDHRYVPLVVSTCMFFSRSWLITRVTRQVSLVEQELPTLLEHLSSLPVFREVRVARSLVFCVMFCRSLFVLMSFIFWPLCCLLLRFIDSDYPFGTFKLFLSVISAGRWFSLGT